MHAVTSTAQNPGRRCMTILPNIATRERSVAWRFSRSHDSTAGDYCPCGCQCGGGRVCFLVSRDFLLVLQGRADVVQSYGGKITECEPNLASREAITAGVMNRTGAHLVHPYNDARVVAGQGTAALELLKEVRDLDMMLAPVSGGGLLS